MSVGLCRKTEKRLNDVGPNFVSIMWNRKISEINYCSLFQTCGKATATKSINKLNDENIIHVRGNPMVVLKHHTIIIHDQIHLAPILKFLRYNLLSLKSKYFRSIKKRTNRQYTVKLKNQHLLMIYVF